MRSFKFFKLLVTILFLGLCGHVLGKECTNIPTQLSSHTFRYELLASHNESLKKQMFEHYHLTPIDDSVWFNLLPRKILREEDEFEWAMMYKSIKNQGFKPPGNFLKEVSLHNVRLDPSSMHWQAQQTNLEYLLMLDLDRLVWSFRKTAGLPTPNSPYGGWEAPDVELRGHFVGHFLSASAQMWAATHNDSLKEKMYAVVSALSECQNKMGTGYLSAFPSEQFDRFEAIKPVWAPYYTIHKILAGLLDQHTFADNPQALKMATWMVEYFYNRVQNVVVQYSVERHYTSLNEETGGMNDVLYRLFSITEDPKHLLLAHLFDKPCFLGILAVQADAISGFHTNTHIPIVIGTQRRYEVTGDTLYGEVAKYFMEIVNSSHSYATGGTSVSEFWSDPKRLASTLQNENEESCTTYNMLKVSRHLFRWTKEMAYADHYERALTNGVLPIQRGTEPGVMIYMLPMVPGGSKAKSFHHWGTPFDSFWCCYGTGIESFSKLGDSIYFEEEGETPGLYVIQYISSSFDWTWGNIVLNQKVDPVGSWDPYLRVTFTVSANKGSGQSSTLNLRIPIWSHLDGAKASLNSDDLELPAPGNFLTVTRKWSAGDKLILQIPIDLRTEAIKDDRDQYASLKAILYGPYLLVGYSHGDTGIKTGSATSLSDWLTPIPPDYNDNLFSFSQVSGNSTFFLTNSNQTITLETSPNAGTDSAVHATFRVIVVEPSPPPVPTNEVTIGKSVMLEPIDFPGFLVFSRGEGENLVVGDPESTKGSSVYRLVEGLNRSKGTVSLESESNEGCFVYSGKNYGSGTSLKLQCQSKASEAEFSREAASFTKGKGLSEYHSISFVAKGAQRNFLLDPLLSRRDESYAVYFDVQP